MTDTARQIDWGIDQLSHAAHHDGGLTVEQRRKMIRVAIVNGRSRDAETSPEAHAAIHVMVDSMLLLGDLLLDQAGVTRQKALQILRGAAPGSGSGRSGG